MTAPPAKIKASLATIKERYIDGDESSMTIQQAWQGLFKMELLLRGVTVPDDDKLYDKIESAIGKALLKDIPKPLLAGMNVMAGRVAEVCANLIASTTSEISTKPIKEAAPAVERANAIKDERWKVLLKAMTNSTDPLHLAQGYFTKAALIQVDTPPMWKKVWDLWSRRLDSDDDCPFPAQVAIQNMIRIAAQKGNVKRVAELNLRLTQSYLNYTNNKFVSDDAIQLSKLFGDSITPKISTDPETIAQSAQQALEDSKLEDLTTTDQILYRAVQVQVHLMVEDAAILQLANTKHQTDQNRSVKSTMERCLKTSRKKYLAGDSSDGSLFQASLSLRDTIVRLWPKQYQNDNDDDNDIPWAQCMAMTQRAMERLQEGATAKTETNKNISAWGVLLEYSLPILETIQTSQCQWEADAPRKQRVENINTWLDRAADCPQEHSLASQLAIQIPFAYWMTLASSSPSLQPKHIQNCMSFLVDLITALLHRPISKSEQEQNAVLGGKKSGLAEKLKSARSAAVCCMCQTHQEMIFHITRDAIARNKKLSSSYLGSLQCMIAWSGWYQRPWAHCSNLSDARRLLATTKVNMGRPLSPLEVILFDLASADAELLNGGVLDEAYKRYAQALEKVVATKSTLDNVNFELLCGLCNNGLARVCLLQKENGQVQEFAQKTIDSLQSLEDLENSDDEEQEGSSLRSLYIWHTASAFSSSRSYQMSVARHLIADSLVAEGRSGEARSFLEAAVADAPLDADAALGLGAFLLRIHFYETREGRTPEANKATQIQLLKAAKLDATKASPFALLGIWFEEQGDLNRAKGCFSKSLQLDASHPVAGRGMLRLSSRENVTDILDAAIHANSSYNGWAWRATGLNKVFLDGEDELAVVALLKSLRCRDVSNVDDETFAIFYDRPGAESSKERADALADVAMCYRRLGRYTAAIRAFHGAIEAAGDTVSSLVLCSCAQVELELALFDHAVDKFSMVLQREKEAAHAIAAYGQGIALLSLAQRDLQDGKAGSAYSLVQQAIEACLNFSENFGCTHKLLGDLYSFGASLPPNVFGDDDTITAVEKQLSFVSQGEAAYNDALDLHKSSGDHEADSEESLVAQAADLCDVANNILLQSRVLCSKHEKGIDFRAMEVPEVNEIYERAAATFQTSIELNPLYAPAWCGLGCAVIARDPLLAQHAFCRCLQLEQMFPDAYSNLGFLYTSFDAFPASEGVMNALTQIADTPMMWMNRAMILERDAAHHLDNQMSDTAEREILQAADAYRAALQVMKHPDAQLGLSISGKLVTSVNARRDDKSRAVASQSQRKDSASLMKEFIGASCRMKAAASVIYGAMSLEQAAERKDVIWSDELVQLGKQSITEGLKDKDLSAFMDTEIFGRCMDVAEGNSHRQQSRFSFPGEQVSLQRQILHSPERPDLWMALAKELTASLEDESPVSKIESAVAAAERASKMLEDSMIHSTRGNPTRMVEADMISEALALVHFLRNLKNERNQAEIEGAKSSSSFEIQRALMMCPNNGLARAAINL